MLTCGAQLGRDKLSARARPLLSSIHPWQCHIEKIVYPRKVKYREDERQGRNNGHPSAFSHIMGLAEPQISARVTAVDSAVAIQIQPVVTP